MKRLGEVFELEKTFREAKEKERYVWAIHEGKMSKS